jgi:flagellar hook-basal body complex protein FliE
MAEERPQYREPGRARIGRGARLFPRISGDRGAAARRTVHAVDGRGRPDDEASMIESAGMQNLLAQLRVARETVAQGLTTSAKPAAGAVGAMGATGAADFGAMLRSTIGKVDAAQSDAATLANRFQMGDTKVSLEDTMVALSKASLSFQELVQVRNRMVSAYRDIMNLQI